MIAADQRILYSGDYPHGTRVEVGTLSNGRIRVIIRGPPPKPKTEPRHGRA